MRRAWAGDVLGKGEIRVGRERRPESWALEDGGRLDVGRDIADYKIALFARGKAIKYGIRVFVQCFVDKRSSQILMRYVYPWDVCSKV